jgi:hypothetical protein
MDKLPPVVAGAWKKEPSQAPKKSSRASIARPASPTP